MEATKNTAAKGAVAPAYEPNARAGEAAVRAGEAFAQARGLGLRTMLGCPYAGVDMTVRFGELTALRGRNNSGKTALLLTLAGRMAHTQGELFILGEKMPKGRGKIQRKIGLGLIGGVNDLPQSLTAAQAASAELAIFGKPSGRDAAAEFLESWNLADIARMSVGDLPREKLVMLGIALGMAGDPRALAVDDVEDQLTARQSARIMDCLAAIAHERGVAVMAACTDRDLAHAADYVYHLS